MKKILTFTALLAAAALFADDADILDYVDAAVSNKADAVRVSAGVPEIVSCAWFDGEKLLTWDGDIWAWHSMLLGGSRELSYSDGWWEYSPSVTPYVYTNAVPIYGFPASLVLYRDGDSVTLTRTNEVYAVSSNAYPVAYMDDILPTVTNTVTKAYVESLGILSEETDPSIGMTNGTIYVKGSTITPLTQYTESDPTVPSWAKSETQPLPPDYATVSNKAMNAVSAVSDTLTAPGIVTDYLASGARGGVRVRFSSRDENNVTAYCYGGIAVRRNSNTEDYLYDETSTKGIVRRMELAAKAEAEEPHTFADGSSADLGVVRSNVKMAIRAVETANGRMQFRLILTNNP